jgi:hypothetical protein
MDRVVWRRPVQLDAPWLDTLADAFAAGELNEGEQARKMHAATSAKLRRDKLAGIIRAVNVLLPLADEKPDSRFAEALHWRLNTAVGEFHDLSRYLRSVHG